jgi:hypothetical protein
MTISDNPKDIYALAGRSPHAASVLSDAKGERIALLHLDRHHSEAEIFALANAGLKRQVGIVALNADMQFESVCLPGFVSPVTRAGTLFLCELLKAQKERGEVAELEKLLKLEDPRAQA